MLRLSDTGVVVLGADQLAQCEVAFRAGARGADADGFLRLTQDVRRALHRLLGVQGDPVIAAQLLRLTRTIFLVDVAVTETAAVAQEVVVHAAVVTVFDTAQLAIAFARAGVTADAALLANARRELHVPFTVVAFGVRFVGEYAGRAHFHRVAGELAFQRAAFRATEVDVVVRAVHAEVGAVRIVFVVTHAPVAGDAAVHLVRDKRPQLLIIVGALGEAVAAEAVAGHYRHILQVTVTAFFTDRAIVRVVGHQPLDHAFTELLRFTVIDGDEGAVGCRGHTGHHQTAARIFRVLVLLYRTLAASADASQRRMPAKVRNIKAEGKTSLQQVVRSVYLILFAVYMNRSHSQHASSGLPCGRR